MNHQSGLAGASVACTLAMIAARMLKVPELALLGLQKKVFGNLWPWLWVNKVPDFEVLAGVSVLLDALAINEFGGRHFRANSLHHIQVLEAQPARPLQATSMEKLL